MTKFRRRTQIVERTVAFVAFDSDLLYQWLNLMNETVRDAGEIESVEGLILGHSSAQTNGVKIHEKFKKRIGKLLDGLVPGYTAHWALSTDGWTSHTQFLKKNNQFGLFRGEFSVKNVKSRQKGDQGLLWEVAGP